MYRHQRWKLEPPHPAASELASRLKVSPLLGQMLLNRGVSSSEDAQAFLQPPQNPGDCVFAKMSANYSADLRSRVEPCVFGGTPDCSQCGCAISSGLHWIKQVSIAGPLKISHVANASVHVGLLANRLRKRADRPSRWTPGPRISAEKTKLVQINP